MTTAPARDANVPAGEMPPVMPASCQRRSASEKLFLLNTGPASLAQVSAVTAAKKAINNWRKTSLPETKKSPVLKTAQRILAVTCQAFLPKVSFFSFPRNAE